MVRMLCSLSVLVLAACMPMTPQQQLPTDCRAEASQAELLAKNWLQQSDIWRLRQSALLEIGPKTFYLEGFLRIDLQQNEARLVALNEMGIVLFDLLVGENEHQLKQANLQKEKAKGFAQGVAKSLREIYFLPQPQLTDNLVNQGNTQLLWRGLSGGSLEFIFDCQARLRETRLVADSGNWRIAYDQYQDFEGDRVPIKIVLNDYHRNVKLSLWTHEISQEEP